MTEEEVRREWQKLTHGGQVPLKLKVSRRNGFYLPDEDGDEQVRAIFRLMTFEDFSLIEDLVSVEYDLSEEGGPTVRELDFSGMRYYMMRRLPMSWSLGIPLHYENGWLTDECFNRIGNLPAPLVNGLLDEYQPYVRVSADEEKVMNRQSVVLFSENSAGVSNACRGISLFCVLSSFWDKFGINVFEIGKLPYKDYLMLRMMIANDNEAARRRIKKNDQPKARTVGPGGRIMRGRSRFART